MKRKFDISLTCALLLWTAAAAGVSAPPASPSPAKLPPSTGFTVVSSIKDLGVLRDGIISEAPAGKILPGRVGLNEWLFTAPGYGIRKIRFRLAAGEVRNIRIDLAKSIRPENPIWKSNEKVLPKDRLAKKVSICEWYQLKTNDGSVCDRDYFLDDLAISEPGLFALSDMQSLQSRGDMESFRRLLHQVFSTEREDLTQNIEDLYARHSSLKSVHQLNALHNLLRGDCPRVHAIWVDAQQVFDQLPEIGLYKSLCLELGGQKEASQALLQAELKAQKIPPAYIFQHAGRQLLEKEAGKAWELANTCVRFHPYDLPCQELGSMAARLDNKFFKGQRYNLEDGTFKTLLNLENWLPQGKYEQAFLAVTSLIQTYPQSLEFYLMLSWIDSLTGFAPRSAYVTQKIAVAKALGGSTLDKMIDALEKGERPQLLISVYRSKLKSQAAEPNLWFRLIRAHARAEECDEVLSVIQEGGQYLPKYSVPLLQMQASCYVEKSQFKPALEVYLKILELKPTAWSSHYNLAAVYERLKMKKDLITAYKRTLEHNPPADIKDNVQYRLLELEGETSSPTSPTKM